MHSRCALLFGLLTLMLGGCVTPQPLQLTSAKEFANPLTGPTGPDVLIMDVALIERPIGDRYLNRDLWTAADEQVIAQEHKGLLEDNGFRVGQVGGLIPPELLSLLTSERSCANPRRMQLRAGKPTSLVLGPLVPRFRFEVRANGQTTPAQADQAQVTLEVVASMSRGGRTRLQFTPLIQHGEATLEPRPAPDRSGWILQEQRPADRYPHLAWDVTLPSNEFVVVGASFDRPGTLGHESFIRKEETPPVQRLLVIRTNRTSSDPAFGTGSGGTEAQWAPCPPLACQAAWTTVRGTSR